MKRTKDASVRILWKARIDLKIAAFIIPDVKDL